MLCVMDWSLLLWGIMYTFKHNLINLDLLCGLTFVTMLVHIMVTSVICTIVIWKVSIKGIFDFRDLNPESPNLMTMGTMLLMEMWYIRDVACNICYAMSNSTNVRVANVWLALTQYYMLHYHWYQAVVHYLYKLDSVLSTKICHKW